MKTKTRPHPRTVRGQPCPICGCNGERELIQALLSRVAELEAQGRCMANLQQRQAQLERRP